MEPNPISTALEVSISTPRKLSSSGLEKILQDIDKIYSIFYDFSAVSKIIGHLLPDSDHTHKQIMRLMDRESYELQNTIYGLIRRNVSPKVICIYIEALNRVLLEKSEESSTQHLLLCTELLRNALSSYIRNLKVSELSREEIREYGDYVAIYLILDKLIPYIKVFIKNNERY